MTTHRKSVDTEPLAELFPDAAQHRFDRRRGRATTALLTVTLLLGALLAGVVAVPALAAGAAGNLALRVWEALPSELAVDRSLPQHLVLLDSTGVEFARVFEQNRSEVTLDQVAPVMVDALIATEDHRFFDHHGLDFTGLTRAAWSNLTGGSTQGASTITQQLVQNILISTATTDEERLVAEGTSLQAKLREARYALAMEKRLSKEDILTGYLNAVYFGNGAYGIAAAARTYFNTTPDQLTLAQSATLVAVLKNPTRFDPISSVEEATKRRNHIITRMSGLGRVDDDVAAAAIAEPVTVTAGATTSGCAASTHPHYCALVLDEIRTNAALGRPRKLEPTPSAVAGSPSQPRWTGPSPTSRPTRSPQRSDPTTGSPPAPLLCSRALDGSSPSPRTTPGTAPNWCTRTLLINRVQCSSRWCPPPRQKRGCR